MAQKLRVNHPLRGFFHRLAGASLGLVLAAALIAGLALSAPLPTAHIVAKRIGFVTATPLAFPPVSPSISYGVSVPALHLGYYPPSTPVSIASITKLMTAYVALTQVDQSKQASTCHTVDDIDVAAYRHEVDTGQSTALIQVGQSLCVPDLIRGLIVHSASDYALILCRLFSTSTVEFVSQMNAMAKALGMSHTVYADPTGIEAGNKSVPRDQLVLTDKLMKFSLVRDAAKLPSIDLPVAGVLNSFTPYAGQYNVIGVKSGRTDAAGGCDVMATQMQFGGKSYLALVAVFGARGGDLLKPAGDAALAVSEAIPTLIATHRFSPSETLGTIFWEGQKVHYTLAQTITSTTWKFKTSSSWRVHMRRINSALPARSVVGWIIGADGAVEASLVTTASLRAPSLWQRIL